MAYVTEAPNSGLLLTLAVMVHVGNSLVFEAFRYEKTFEKWKLHEGLYRLGWARSSIVGGGAGSRMRPISGSWLGFPAQKPRLIGL